MNVLAQPVSDSTTHYRRQVPPSGQRDLRDVVRTLFPQLGLKPASAGQLPVDQLFVGIIPELSYSPQTRFLAEVEGAVAYRRPKANVSTISPDVAYSQNNQLLLSTGLNLWSAGNHLKWAGDYRFYAYPQATYGLGTSTRPEDELQINSTWLRAHQTLLWRVGRNLYVGPGIHLDIHKNIHTERQGIPVPIDHYTAGIAGRSVSSGLSLNVLYDERTNSLNPEPSTYANLMLRTNLRILGSDATYQAVLLDIRRYLYVSNRSAGMLAFWLYGQFTIGSNPPYLDLPYTAGDGDERSGRGYVQGRFRGRQFLYQEIEYRFPLLRNGLIGGVIFVNNQLTSEPITNAFGPSAPAFGLGGRLQIDKSIRLNLTLDYGIGLGGSRGFYFSFGEYF